MEYEFFKEELDNGLTVLVEPRPERKVVATNLRVEGGSMNEDMEKKGMMHLLEHLIFGSSESRSGKKDIMSKGGWQNASVNHVNTKFYGEISEKYSMNLISDLINTAFHSKLENLERDKKIVIEEEKKSRDSSSGISIRNLGKILYKNGSLLSTYDIEKSPGHGINPITQEEIEKKYKKIFHPNNASISIVGPVEKEKVIEKINEMTSNLEKKKKPKRNRLIPKKNSEKLIETEKDIKTCYVYLGALVPGYDYESEEYWDLNVILSLLDSSAGGILYERLREERGIVYSVDSGKISTEETSSFLIDFHCSPENLEEALDVTKKSLTDLKELKDEDLDLIKRQEIEGRKLNRDKLFKEASKLTWFYSRGALDYLNRYEEEINSVTPERIRRTAERYLDPENFKISIVKPK